MEEMKKKRGGRNCIRPSEKKKNRRYISHKKYERRKRGTNEGSLLPSGNSSGATSSNLVRGLGSIAEQLPLRRIMHSLMRKRETASYLLHGLLTDDVLLEQCPPERQEALLPLAPCTIWAETPSALPLSGTTYSKQQREGRT